MGLELSRLERTPDKREVGGSSPLKPIRAGNTFNQGGKAHLSPLWGISSVGRAPALQAGGHEFESRILHCAYIAPRERCSLGRVQARYKTKYFKAYGSKLPTHKIFVLQCTLKTAYKK